MSDCLLFLNGIHYAVAHLKCTLAAAGDDPEVSDRIATDGETDGESEGDIGLDELVYCGRMAGCPVGVPGIPGVLGRLGNRKLWSDASERGAS